MAELFDVVVRQTGERVVIGVDEETARDERARLDAEAKTLVDGRPNAMWRGQIVKHEVVAR